MSFRNAANHLHHLSMRYAGALIELISGKPVGLIPKDHPGLSEARDFIDLILLTRAEINGLSALLIKKGVFTAKEVETQFAEEYEWLCKQKAQQLNIVVEDYGLVFKKPDGSSN